MREASRPSTARDKLDSIVKGVYGDAEEVGLLPVGSHDSLRFGQLKPTSSKEDSNLLPGLRRLG
jgi:hypothetical protein